MNKRRVIILVCIAAVVLAFFGLRAISFPLALMFRELSTSDVNTLSQGFNPNGDEYQVVQTSNAKTDQVLAYVVRDKWGFWSVWYTAGDQTPDAHYATIGWTNTGGYRIYGINDDPEVSWEVHLLLIGDNANRKIELPENLLPEGVATNISQSENSYKIHLVTYGDALNNFDLHQLLVDQGDIAP